MFALRVRKSKVSKAASVIQYNTSYEPGEEKSHNQVRKLKKEMQVQDKLIVQQA